MRRSCRARRRKPDASSTAPCRRRRRRSAFSFWMSSHQLWIRLTLGGKYLQAKPSSCQTNPNKIAWICRVLFVRIGTFQWVVAKKIRKIPRSLLLAAEQPARRAGSNRRFGEDSTNSDFRKKLHGKNRKALRIHFATHEQQLMSRIYGLDSVLFSPK